MNCIQCFKKLEKAFYIAKKQYGVCKNPECPNFGLLQKVILKKNIELKDTDTIQRAMVGWPPFIPGGKFKIENKEWNTND